MQQFVMAYLPTQGERLLRQLSGRLREFGQTPLLLWMLCSLFQQSEQIPPNLGMVFRAFTVGYGDRIKQDVTLSKDSRAWWGRLLQYLAFKMTCGENLTELQVAISRREAEQFLVEFLRGKVEFADDCAVRWLEDLLKHHLIQISNDRIEFRHQLIQEYYAAEWLLGLLPSPSLSDARLRQVYLNYLKWTEPLALMLELVEGEEHAVRVVRLALEVDLRLGARLAGAVRYGFQEKTVGLLIQEIDERKIPKLYAIKILGETKSQFVHRFLAQYLEDSNSSVRIQALQALESCDNRDIEHFIQMLNDQDNDVRSNAVLAVERIGGDTALEFIGRDTALEHIAQNLYDQDNDVRRNTILVIERIGGYKAIELLVETSTYQYQDNDVRIKALLALLRLSGDEIGRDKAIDLLIQSLNHKDDHARANACMVLGIVGNEKAIEPLILSLNDNDRLVVRSAITALGKIGDEKVINPLIQTLNAHVGK